MQVLAIDAGSAVPIYVQLMDQIRTGVRDGKLKLGEGMPSVRQLAAELEINPNTVAKAYLLLEREGILRTQPRRGCFIAETAAARARRSVGERLDETVARVLEETMHLGLDRREILEAIRQKLGEKGSHSARKGGRSQ